VALSKAVTPKAAFIVGIIVVARLAAEAPTSPTSLEGVLQLGRTATRGTSTLNGRTRRKTRVGVSDSVSDRSAQSECLFASGRLGQGTRMRSHSLDHPVPLVLSHWMSGCPARPAPTSSRHVARRSWRTAGSRSGCAPPRPVAAPVGAGAVGGCISGLLAQGRPRCQDTNRHS
jgi:hypothetical protein